MNTQLIANLLRNKISVFEYFHENILNYFSKNVCTFKK
jgi:hypothetical protein